MERKLCLLPRLKLWWRFFIDVNKWISLAWIIFFFVLYRTYGSVILKLHYFLPPAYSNLQAFHFWTFPWISKVCLCLLLPFKWKESSVCCDGWNCDEVSSLISMRKCLPYSVTPGDQLCTYPVTFPKLNKRKEKLLFQTSALKFLLHACKFLTLLILIAS